MVSAIGSSATSSAFSSTVASPAALEARIARDKKELSSCVNCESAKTKQGQANIQALASKISLAEAHLEEIRTSNGNDSAAKSNSVASIAESKATDESARAPNSADSNTGRFVDVFV